MPRLKASGLPETPKDWLTQDLVLVLVSEGCAVVRTQAQSAQVDQDAGCRLPGSRLTEVSAGQQDSALSSDDESLHEGCTAAGHRRPRAS